MKFLRNIFIFVGIIIVLVGALVAITFDGSGTEMLPTHLYTDEYDSAQMIFEELNMSFEDVENGVTADLLVDLDDDILNRFIYEKILTVNEDYSPGSDCATDEECYVVASSSTTDDGSINAHMVGIYGTFFDGSTEDDPGRLVLNMYFEVDFNGLFTYKTVLEAHFLFEDDTYDNQYVLEFDKLQIGNIRVPKKIFTWMIDQAYNSGAVELEEVENGLPIGDLDLSDLSYTIKKDEILTELSDSSNEGEYNQLTQELLSITFDRDLILLDLQEDKFALEVQVSQFRNTDEDKRNIPLYLYDLHDQQLVAGETVYGEFNSELFDPVMYLQDVFTQFLFNGALNLGAESQNFEIDEEIFNKLIYSNANGFVNARKVETIEISDSETKDIELGLKSIWFEFDAGDEFDLDDDRVYAHALFSIAGVDSLLVLEAEVEYNEVTVEGESVTEMHCEFVDITFGKDLSETEGQYIQISDLTTFKDVFSNIGDVQFGEFDSNGDLIINPTRLTTLLVDGVDGNSIKVVGVSVVDGALALEIEAPDHQAILDSFQEALNDVLASDDVVTNLFEALNPEAGSVEEAVYDAVVDIQEDLELGNDINDTQVDALLEGFEDMDEESQTEFLDTFGVLLEETGNGNILAQFESAFGDFVDE